MAECQNSKQTRSSRSCSRSRKNHVNQVTQDENIKEEPKMNITPDTFIESQKNSAITTQTRIISSEDLSSQHSRTQPSDSNAPNNEISLSSSWVTGRKSEAESSLSSEDTLDEDVLNIHKLKIGVTNDERSPQNMVIEPQSVISHPVISQEAETVRNQSSEDNNSRQEQDEDVENKDPLKIGAAKEINSPEALADKKESDCPDSSVISKTTKIKHKFQTKESTADKSNTLAGSSLCNAIHFYPMFPRRETEERERNVAPTYITHPQKASIWSCTGTLTELGDLRFKENRYKEPHVLGGRCIPHTYNTSSNIFHAVTNATFGRTTSHNKQAVSSQIASNISNFEVVDGDYPFGTRFTTLDWHPRKRNTLLACSNQGDIAVYTVGTGDYAALSSVETFPGFGPGGAITDLKFHPTEDHLFFTSSMCGKISLKDITGRSNKILLDQCYWQHYFSAVEAHQTDRLVLGGQSNGYVNLLTREGEPIWEKELHVQEITSISFSPRDSALFITSSTDRTVRLWDIRKVEDRKPVDLLFHNKGISSAYFSETDGNRLLTTDLDDEIRVYKSPSWRMETCIRHPHNSQKHRTSIKASWHPHRDMIVCGRNPDKSHPKYSDSHCIDIFDAVTGKWIGETKDTLYDGIPSLSKVNRDGDKLAIVMGYNVTLWNNEATFAYHELSKTQMDNFTKSRNKVCGNVRMRGRDDSIERRKKKDRKDEKLKGETETETETEMQEEREFAPQFVQHIGGARLRINMTNVRPRQGNRIQARTNGESRRSEAPAVNQTANTGDSELETTHGASSAGVGTFTELPSLQTPMGGGEIQMDDSGSDTFEFEEDEQEFEETNSASATAIDSFTELSSCQNEMGSGEIQVDDTHELQEDEQELETTNGASATALGSFTEMSSLQSRMGSEDIQMDARQEHGQAPEEDPQTRRETIRQRRLGFFSRLFGKKNR